MSEWPGRYRSRSKVIVCDTPSHASNHLCLIWKESIQNCRCYRVDTACWTDIFQQVYCKVMPEWPWRYRSRSKINVRSKPSHASHHFCHIWKESIQSCRCYRVDTACGTDGQTEWNQYSPHQLRNIMIKWRPLLLCCSLCLLGNTSTLMNLFSITKLIICVIKHSSVAKILVVIQHF